MMFVGMATRVALLVCSIIASSIQNVLTVKPEHLTEFPKFPDDFSATGTLAIAGKNFCFRLWFSKHLKSSRSEIKNHGRVDTKYKLEKMGSFGTEINLETNFEKTICTIKKGNGWKPVQYEPFFSKFVEKSEYRGKVNVNGVNMKKWTSKNNHWTSTLLVREDVNGPTPYRMFSEDNNSTMTFETFDHSPPPAWVFLYDTGGCRNAPGLGK